MDNQEGCCSKPNKSPKQDCCSKPNKGLRREVINSPRSGVRIVSLLLIALLFLFPLGGHYTLNAKTVLTDHTMSLIKGGQQECRGRTCECETECGGSGREGTACTGADDCGGLPCVPDHDCEPAWTGYGGYICQEALDHCPDCDGGTKCSCGGLVCDCTGVYGSGCNCGQGICKCKKD